MNPIAEQILDNIAQTLLLVREKAGYANDIDADRPDPVVNPWADLGAIASMGDPEPVEGCLGFQTWDLPVVVTVGLITTESSADLHETRMNSAAADVYQALLVDETRGGLALSTEPGPMSKDENGVNVPFTIRFRHIWGNPFEQQQS